MVQPIAALQSSFSQLPLADLEDLKTLKQQRMSPASCN
jgi:hypothetical protein